MRTCFREVDLWQTLFAMKSYICLLLMFLPTLSKAQTELQALSPVPDYCSVTLTAVVSVDDACYTFWISYGGPSMSLRRFWTLVTTVLLPDFLADVLALFPDQQAEIVFWSAEWG